MPGDVLLVLAKEPVPGRVKTRLCPPCTPAQAAAVAAAALAATLDAVAATAGVHRRVVALDGAPGEWLPAGFEVVAQGDGGLDERLARAYADTLGSTRAPLLQIGMDTPQVTPSLLRAALDALHDADAVLGLAEDGGWWAMGVHAADPRVVLGVPMSTDTTGRRQRDRLESLGLRVATLPTLRDVDRWDDAQAVAALNPAGPFAAAVRRVDEATSQGRGGRVVTADPQR